MRNLNSRRTFLTSAVLSGAAAGFFVKSNPMSATPLNIPVGLQLYTVGKEMEADPHGTLKHVAAVGYREVELSPTAKLPAKELRKMLDEVGLKTPAGHFLLPDLLNNLPKALDDAKELGQEYMVVTVPWVADPSRFTKKPGEGDMEFFLNLLNHLTLDDWKWNAEQFNTVGEKVKQAGLQLGYHNHNFEFRREGSTTGYDTFLRLTDPNLVRLELDCGWMTVAGQDPVAYLTRYPDRYRLLHIKDFHRGFTPTTTLLDKRPGAPVATELGRGAIDYTKIFAAARNLKIRAMFVEQEPPFTEMPALEAIQVDYDYIRRLPS